jgi:hypothetical protein
MSLIWVIVGIIPGYNLAHNDGIRVILIDIIPKLIGGVPRHLNKKFCSFLFCQNDSKDKNYKLEIFEVKKKRFYVYPDFNVDRLTLDIQYQFKRDTSNLKYNK